jgi:hypothetical protein
MPPLRYALLALLALGTAPCASAQAGHALAFSPFQNDEVAVPLATPGGPFTLEAWVRFYGDPDAFGYYTILEFGDDQPFLGVTGSGLGVAGVVSSANAFPVGTWQHVAYTYDGETSRLYLNGAEEASSTAAPPREGAALGIGYGIGDTAWPGSIDEVVVWDRARTAAEVAGDMDGLSTEEVADPALLAYFRFDEGEGQTAANERPGGPAGTLGPTTDEEVNDPTWISVSVPTAGEGDAPGALLRLSEVRPNPARSGGALTLEVARAQHVRVALYDAVGRQVAVLHDGLVAAGRPVALTLGAGRLPGGAYVVRATGPDGAATRQVTLLR